MTVVYRRKHHALPTAPGQALTSFALGTREDVITIAWHEHAWSATYSLAEPQCAFSRVVQVASPKRGGKCGKEKRWHRRTFAKSSGSLVLRSGLVVYAKPDC